MNVPMLCPRVVSALDIDDVKVVKYLHHLWSNPVMYALTDAQSPETCPEVRLIRCWSPTEQKWVDIPESTFRTEMTSVRRLSGNDNYLVVTLRDFTPSEEELRGERVLTVKELEYLGVRSLSKNIRYIRLFTLKNDPSSHYGICYAESPNAKDWTTLGWEESLYEAVRLREHIIRSQAKFMRYIRVNEKPGSSIYTPRKELLISASYA